MGRRAAAAVAAVTAAAERTLDGAAAVAAVVDGGRVGAGREAKSPRRASDQSRKCGGWTSDGQARTISPVMAAEAHRGQDSHSNL